LSDKLVGAIGQFVVPVFNMRVPFKIEYTAFMHDVTNISIHVYTRE